MEMLGENVHTALFHTTKTDSNQGFNKKVIKKNVKNEKKVP